MEKVCKRVCFELEQQFSTSIDLSTPEHFPGADSCVESSDLPTAAPLSFTQLLGIAVFFCRRLSSRTHCECLWHRIWCRAKPERGHVAAGRPVRAAPCPGEIFTGSCKRTRCPGCCSGQQLRGVVMPSKTCWGFSAAPQGPDQQVPSGEG